ncbi:MAG: hypothetical protein ACI8R4_003325 [Paracoccaceae bacterium]|jgi:hypothetical protein
MMFEYLDNVWMVNRTLILHFTPKSRTKISSRVFRFSFWR